MTCDGTRTEVNEEAVRKLAEEMTRPELRAAYFYYRKAGMHRLRRTCLEAITLSLAKHLSEVANS